MTATGQTGQPPVLLLHGFASTAEETFGQPGWIRALEQAGRRVIAPDLPGHGSSEAPLPQTRADLLSWAADQAEAARRETGSVDVAGYSLGSTLAWELALMPDAGVRRLVLAGVPRRDHLADLAEGVTNESTLFLAKATDAAGDDEAQRRLEAVVKAAAEDPFNGAERLAAEGPPEQLVLVAAGSQDQLALMPAEVKAAARLFGTSDPDGLVVQGRDHVSVLPSRELRKAVVDALGG
ncbi:alpha/beta fold hydrolase [Falsarthrobacter nasiphocae]|uniref:Pimeloyl-ACP methyl ester carboxylesterase n=1 Tax=Falsarthrobacter nasiphocae TaxID=189863 RepID=A0AAE4C5Z6_9MICC|nr:alpha/beta fold hydrolase [Falsarthrobacter nasiphocae]MDR6892806.1 pimeloyl-ACP methyl ester carboxylesterase [Falsarthrobacter nasiphocae]